MKVTLSSGNRVTIPKAVMEELHLSLGQSLELNIVEGNIVITTNVVDSIETTPEIEEPEIEINNQESKEEQLIDTKTEVEEIIDEKEESKSIVSFPIFNKFKKEEPKEESREEPVRYKKVMVNGIKIVSNLEEGAKFSRKVYSDCNLVIRTKRSSIDRFCEACQGELAYQYGVLNHPCRYINIPERVEIEEPKEVKSNPVKNIVKNLTSNIAKLDSKLNTKIDSYKQEDDYIEDDYIEDDYEMQTEQLDASPKQDDLDKIMIDQYNHIKRTMIRAVNYSESVKRCCGCREFFNKGFLLDNQFYCKHCALEDFKNFLNLRKECE